MATFEAKKDYSAEVKVAIEECAVLLAQKGIDETVAFILPLEKKCRVNNDFVSLKEVSVHLVRICKESQSWAKLNDVLSLINKRSATNKTTLTAVVTEAMTYLDLTPSLETKIALMKTLIDVCEGKLFVESESAHLHFKLAKIYEDQGSLGEACDTIQDVHVETYGSLSKLEKAKYIIEQIRLNLLQKDFIRTAIHSRKMNLKTIEEEGFEEIKVKFYTLQIEFHTQELNCWEICQAYHKIATTKTNDSLDVAAKKYAWEATLLFLLLSKHNTDQQALLKTVVKALSTAEVKSFGLSDAFKHLVELFTTSEIIVTPFAGQAELENHHSLRRFNSSNAQHEALIKLLNSRVIEHNLRVVAQFYEQISLRRLQQLTNLTADVLESHLSELSFAGDLTLKIDRPAAIVSFRKKRSPEQVLTEWSGDISKMLTLMESTCHLINRENMVYKA